MHDALVFVTHIWTDNIEAEFERIRQANCVDTWLSMDGRTPGLSALSSRYQRSHKFDLALLCRLGYPTIPTHSLNGNAHFLALDFFLHHLEYEFYWFVEFDVRYTGEWDTFLRRYNRFDHDLVSTHIRWFDQESLWVWWPTFGHRTRTEPAPREWIRSFNVIYRISRRALQFLHDELPTGWHGHHEVLMATVLHQYGFSLLDFGGNGPFTPMALRNIAYTSCPSAAGELTEENTTMRYRPVHAMPGDLPNMLYHPIKDGVPEDSFALSESDLFRTCSHQLIAPRGAGPQSVLCDHPLAIKTPLI